MPTPAAIAAHFMPAAEITAVIPHGHGNVNDTYLVSLRLGNPFILQRINGTVFKDPAAIMHNLRVISHHLTVRCKAELPAECWQAVHLLPTCDGKDFHRDEDNGVWRALSFIDKAVAFDTIQNEQHARQVGFALGRFQRLLADLDPGLLRDTLPGFHVTPRYLAEFRALAATTTAQRTSSADVRYCHALVDRCAPWAGILEEARAAGNIRERIIHGDPKVANILLDRQSGRAAALIDLDTVKPGLIHYDVGDCLRSACNPAGEEIADPTAARFDPDICQAILEGYLGEAGLFLTHRDLALFFDAIRLIAFELGLRFFTDWLAGNVYFKTCHPEQNLHRALVQFRLLESIEGQEKTLRQLIRELAPRG